MANVPTFDEFDEGVRWFHADAVLPTYRVLTVHAKYFLLLIALYVNELP